MFPYMDVSVNSGTPKSSILIGFSIKNRPFWGTPIFGNTHIYHKTHPNVGIFTSPMDPMEVCDDPKKGGEISSQTL